MKAPLLVSAGTTLPDPGHEAQWGRLLGAGLALATAEMAAGIDRPLLVLAEDPRHADQLEAEIRFFGGNELRVEHFVEWETLPWDTFSPHQDIVSERLRVLANLPTMQRGVVIAAVNALQQRLPPVEYVSARSLSLREGQSLPRDEFTTSLVAAGYLRVPQVSEHGEFAVRGSLIDVFPMGADSPVRIDFFDDDIESLRWFSPETQLSGERVSTIDVLPAREVPLDDDAVRAFRDRYRERFEGQPSKSRVYREVSDGIAHGGIEYYLPLFFDTTRLAARLSPAALRCRGTSRQRRPPQRIRDGTARAPRIVQPRSRTPRPFGRRDVHCGRPGTGPSRVVRVAAILVSSRSPTARATSIRACRLP